MMSLKTCNALAEAIRKHHDRCPAQMVSFTGKCDSCFTPKQLNMLADFCLAQNPRFDRECWDNFWR